MTNPALWLSIAGAIYALINRQTGWLLFCFFTAGSTLIYTCILAELRSKEIAAAAKSIINFNDGYITRMIPALNMFFNMKTYGCLIFEPIFCEGSPNEVRVNLDYDFLLSNEVDEKTAALAQIVQGFFNSNFALPENFSSCLNASLHDAKEAHISTKAQALLLAIAQSPQKIRPAQIDIQRFNQAVFIVQFSVKGEPVAVRTFHITPHIKNTEDTIDEED